jgi:hypothetical protein
LKWPRPDNPGKTGLKDDTATGHPGDNVARRGGRPAVIFFGRAFMPVSKPRAQRRKTKPKYNRESGWIHFYTREEWHERQRRKLGMHKQKRKM